MADLALEFLNGPRPGSSFPPTNQAPLASDFLSGPRPELPEPARLQAGTRTAPLTGRAQLIAENQEPGVMLDIDTGAPASVRAGLGLRRTREDVVAYLQDLYGPEAVRPTVDKTGWIVRIPDPETGQLKDILVDEDKMTAKDLLDVTSAIPEVAGSLLALRRGRFSLPLPSRLAGARGVAGITRDIALGTASAQTAGAATDIGVRMYDEQPVNLPEIIKSRMQMAGVEALSSGGLIAGAAATRKVLNRFMAPLSSNIGEAELEAAKSVVNVERKTGERIELSVAEATGSPMMARTETFLENVPGARSRFLRFKAKQEQQLAKVQKFLLGPGQLPEEAAVGRQAVQALRGLTKAADEAVDQATKTAIRGEQDRILRTFDALSIPERKLLSEEVGEAVRARAMELRAGFEALNEVNYALVKRAPGGTDDIISIARLKQTIKELQEEFGRVPAPEAQRFFEEYSKLPDKLKLHEVRNMRRMINDQMDRVSALPGPGNYVLGKMSSAITRGIDESVSALPNGELKRLLTKANDHYKKHHGDFRQQGIAELFRDPNTPGHIGPAEIVTRIVGGKGNPDLYSQMRKFLGPDSSEWKMLKRSMLDDIYERSLVGGTSDQIDGKAFVNAIHAIDRNIAADLLGPRGAELFRAGNTLASLRAGKLSRADLEAALGPGASMPVTVSNAIRRNAERDRIYRNQIVKKFAAGELGAEAIRPEEFVGRYLEQATVPEMREVMSRLNASDPSIVEGIRRKTIQRIFQDAARRPTAEDLVRRVGGDPTAMVSGESLVKALGHENRRAIYQEVLGKDTYDLLLDYVKIEAVRGKKDMLGGMAGGLAQGGLVSRILNLKFGEALTVAKYRLAGILMTAPPIRKWLSHSYQVGEIDDLARAIVVSEPFLRGFTEEFGQDTGAYRVLSQIKRGVGLEPQPEFGPQPAPAQP